MKKKEKIQPIESEEKKLIKQQLKDFVATIPGTRTLTSEKARKMVQLYEQWSGTKLNICYTCGIDILRVYKRIKEIVKE